MRNRRTTPVHYSYKSYLPALLVACLPFVVFAPIAFVRRVFSAQDIQAYFFPYHVLPARIVAAGHLPLWNPYVFSGIPLLADGQTAMLYPPNWLFFLLPGAAALNYTLLLQFSIAGVGMYLFARSLDLSRLPSFISAVAYMFCGFLTARVVHLSIMSGAALIPFIFFCLDRMLAASADRRDLRVRWFAATSVALALQAVAGHPQMPVYTALAAFVYANLRSIEHAVGARRWLSLVTGPLLLAGAYVLGYALAAVQLLPWSDLARFSVRAAGADYGFVFGTSTTGSEWLLFIFPYLLGAPGNSVFTSGRPEIEDAVRAWEHSAYVGMLPLALAAVALWHLGELTLSSRGGEATLQASERTSILRRRWYSLLFLVLLIGTGVILAAGWHTPAAALVYKTPVLGSLRAVERGLVLASFALAVMAGFGLQRILEWPERRAAFVAAAICIVGAVTLCVWLEHLRVWSPVVYVPAVFAGFTALLLVQWSRRRAGRVTLGLAATLVVCDMGLYAIAFNSTASPAIYRHRPRPAVFLRRNSEPFRKATVLVETNDITTRVAQETLALSWGMVYGVEDINGFNSLQPRRYTDYLFGSERNDVSYGYLRDPRLFRSDDPILSSLNVKYVLLAQGVRMPLGSHLRLIFENATVQVYENTQAYARAFFTDRVRSELDPRAVFRHVTAAGFDGRREAVVESGSIPSLPAPTTKAWCEAIEVSPNELHVRTLTSEPRFVVVSEMDMPGWRADIDGTPTTVYRTNYLFRGVVVPAGQHVVRFVYRPRSVMIGAAVSATAVIVLGVLLLCGVRVRRRTHAPQDVD